MARRTRGSRNLPQKAEEPALHCAARLGDEEAIRRLVAEGADLNALFDIEQDPGARANLATPLMVAAGSGDGATIETVRLLLELGADPKITASSNTAAALASTGLDRWEGSGGDADRLRLLLAAGSPLPEGDKEVNRLLCHTVALGDPERLAVLLEHGLKAQGYWNVEEAREEHRACMEIMDRYEEERPDPFEGLSEELRELMAETSRKMDEEMFEQHSSGPSSYEIPLFCAVGSGSVECVALLLEAGADPMIRDNSRRTALYCANSFEMIQILLEAGLPLDDADQYGWCPLTDAITDGKEALPRILALIEAGANVNATHDHGYTVFMSAVGSSRDIEVLKALIAAGADPHAITELGYNAFHAAIDVNGEANLEESVRETLGFLKELGVDLEHRNQGGRTPLARALQHGTGTEVRVLCDLGADPNATCPMHKCGEDECGVIDLPLIFHAANGIGVHADEKTEALLRAGADPMRKDGEGFDPFERTVASLCSDAQDYAATYQTFFQGLHELWQSLESEASTKDEFVEDMRKPIRAYAEKFAKNIPMRRKDAYTKETREEQISCIASLGAYIAWASKS